MTAAMRPAADARDAAANLPATTRLRANLPSLLPSETRVARRVLADPASAVDATAQQLADAVGVARSTVVRMCRRLGYDGYPQFRVALARDLPSTLDEVAAPGDAAHDSVLARARADARRLCADIEHALDAITEERLARIVGHIAAASRVVVAANGSSAPVALDLAMRLTAAGRPAEHIADALAQQIAARQLHHGDLAIIVSASGMNALTLRAAAAAAESDGALLVLTSNADAPIARLADLVATVVPPAGAFREEIEQTSRIHFAVAVEVLVQQVRRALGTESTRARSDALGVVGANLVE